MIVHIIVGHSWIYLLFNISKVTRTEVSISTVNAAVCVDDIIVCTCCTYITVSSITFMSYSDEERKRITQGTV